LLFSGQPVAATARFARKKEKGVEAWRAPARFFAAGAATTSLRPPPEPLPFGGERKKWRKLVLGFGGSRLPVLFDREDQTVVGFYPTASGAWPALGPN